ncbi:MAG TPA: KTSC domain-containing protein [Candidatus Angelobacter sp.]|nr:KTSC domain-containing protein [Candidatus Angelobacter sp.]
MNWITIEGSTAIGRAGYDAAAKVMGVETLAGGQYFYSDVPPRNFDDFMGDKSKGRAWALIKKNFVQVGAAASTKDKAPKDEPVITVPKEPADMVPVTVLAISFEAGQDSVGFPPLPFEQMVTHLREKMDAFCAPLVTEISDLSNQALKIEVTNAATYEQAGELGKKLAVLRRRITAMMKPPKQSIDSVKGVVLTKEKELGELVGVGEEHLAKGCTAWRSAEQRRATEAAQQEQARRLRDAEDKRISDAEKAQAAGRDALADKLLSTPVTAPKVQIASEVPQGVGRGRVNYRFRVLDAAAVPRDWLTIDEKKVGEYARKSKLPNGTLLHGIEFYQEEDTSF